MKIELDLPDWVDERNIYIFAGIEAVAEKTANNPWLVKTGRCSLCGTCCKNKITGKPCEHLKFSEGDRGYLCKLGFDRPFSCCVGDGRDNDKCTIKWIDTSKK